MLFVSVSSSEFISRIPSGVDGIELRLDLFSEVNLENLKKLIVETKIPLLFTLRKASQGGQFTGSEPEREILIEKLLELEPAYFDLESEMHPAFIKKICQKFKKTKILISYHNFKEVPQELDLLYKEMTIHSAYGYKIAAQPKTTNDALRLLLFGRKYPHVSVIAMGEKGEFARVLGKVFGNVFDYASLGEHFKTAPGQLTVHELLDTYDYHRLNSQTHLYGLIGDPVSKSLGHLFHNNKYKEKGWDSLYVKMVVLPEELASFFPLAVEAGFRGLSVTMPLKEKVIPFLNSLEDKAKQIGAVNTLLMQKDQIFGFNTDGIGALDALERYGSIAGKKMVLIGAGGAARAIAIEGKARGAHLMILNRSLEKAQIIACEVDGEAGLLSQIPLHYDVLVNCSPNFAWINSAKLLPEALIMDIVYVPRETPLLCMALKTGCRIVYGDEMFYNQAEAQVCLGIGI